MRSFPSDALRPLDRPRALFELDEPNDHEPLISTGVPSGISLLLLIVLGLAMAASFLINTPH
jgi:hypothetical protein